MRVFCSFSCPIASIYSLFYDVFKRLFLVR
ncbi:4Fe-4S binding protein [Rhizobium rhizogenes]|uniref:4Fe-4S binding protein n=1 Tax=Rhizobium rhizogenes TaxID=359 RepID=A0AA88EZ21_RHIRH|nr:4Fe-4S binding protein [Rhizobium rhizogenes]